MKKHDCKENKGQSLVEWGVIILAITTICMATLLAFGPKMQNMWAQISGTFDQSSCEEAGGTWNVDANACIGVE